MPGQDACAGDGDGMVAKAEELATEIRPGVVRPDWSAVTTPAARNALSGRMSARAGLLDKWSHALDPDEDLVWRNILKRYATMGRPPQAADLAGDTGIPSDRVGALLRKLQLRDLVGLENESDKIRHAYPFTESETGHRVGFGRHVLSALCAIDALGVGDMYRTDIRVQAQCRSCGETISVVTTDQGRKLGSVAPAGAVIWYDFAYGDSAASSCCPSIAFFCSDEHLRRWLEGQEPARAGVRLSMNEGLELGRAIFAPILREPVSALP